jgi:hypothetical protein
MHGFSGLLTPFCAHPKRRLWEFRVRRPGFHICDEQVSIQLRIETLPLIRKFFAATGYIFATKSGRPMANRNLHRALHATGIRVGFHAFRRFRTETLRRARVPSDLERLWLGHTQKTITDLYATGLQQDRAWRREWAERVGLGFSLDGLRWATNSEPIAIAQAA